LQGVLAGPHNPPMPVLGNTQHLRRQVADLVGQLLLTDTGADHRASLDLVEQLHRLILGIKKLLRAGIFVGDRLLHSNDATTPTEH
jgi:hypothetical protein